MKKLKPNLIKTKRLTLHQINPSDEEKMLEIFSSSEVKKTYMLPDFKNLDDMKSLFHKFIDLSNDLTRFIYGIYLNDTLIGFLNDVVVVDDMIELGYVINPKYKNNGYMTEVLICSIETLFKMNYQIVRCGAFSNNIASIRVMEKAHMEKIDFVEEINYNNKIHSCVYYESRI